MESEYNQILLEINKFLSLYPLTSLSKAVFLRKLEPSFSYWLLPWKDFSDILYTDKLYNYHLNIWGNKKLMFRSWEVNFKLRSRRPTKISRGVLPLFTSFAKCLNWTRRLLSFDGESARVVMVIKVLTLSYRRHDDLHRATQPRKRARNKRLGIPNLKRGRTFQVLK